MNLPRSYDEWRLRGPYEQTEIGTEEGDECGRYPDIDEDAPRGYRPKRCRGVMSVDEDGFVFCERCGEVA